MKDGMKIKKITEKENKVIVTKRYSVNETILHVDHYEDVYVDECGKKRVKKYVKEWKEYKRSSPKKYN